MNSKKYQCTKCSFMFTRFFKDNMIPAKKIPCGLCGGVAEQTKGKK